MLPSSSQEAAVPISLKLSQHLRGGGGEWGEGGGGKAKDRNKKNKRKKRQKEKMLAAVEDMAVEGTGWPLGVGCVDGYWVHKLCVCCY